MLCIPRRGVPEDGVCGECRRGVSQPRERRRDAATPAGGTPALQPAAALLLTFALAFAARADDPPARAQDTITVTATRTATRLADTPSSTVILSRQAIATSAAATVDDTLRQVPGFTLFRRNGSRTANPTAQGVSLRGVGASGASRALVLDDGVPLNDPFGGWVYWGRVPLAALERIEVMRGGASDLYGSGAMSGVIQFIRRAPAQPAVTVDSSAGSERSGATSVFASAGSGAWRGSLAADLFTTAGYVLVEPEQRGPVDTAAGSRHTSFDAAIERSIGDASRLFIRGSRYGESRQNGTALQTNDTEIRQLAAGADMHAGGGSLDLRVYGTDQDYAQTFSAIATDRASERLTVAQRVPSRSRGGNAQWSVPLARRQALLTGIEFREVSGVSDEDQFSARGTTHVRSEGEQRSLSGFLEDVMEVWPDLSVTAALRFDSWSNLNARRDATELADRSDRSWSPRLSALYRATERLAFTAAAYRAFRAPTLNELYRGFRLGNVVTLANGSLGPERLSSVEAGVRYGSVRANAFFTTVGNTIANVTLSSTPSLITRQRQNLGTTRTGGVELEGDWHVARRLNLSAGYLLSDARVRTGDLAGRRLPQVPRSQASLQAVVDAGGSTVAVQARWSAMQFDDDLNELPLRGYTAVDAFASHTLTARIALTVAVENLFDQRIEAGATPVITLGQPRALRVGFRYSR